MKPELQFSQPPIEISLNVNTPNWQAALIVDWQAFGLNALDNMQRSLANIKFNVPNNNRRTGIKRFDIVLYVVINKQGKATLVAIKDNPYPSFKKEINRIIKLACFTPPKKMEKLLKRDLTGLSR